MATASTTPFEELTKLATDFVTSQSGMWDHKAWEDFLARVQQQDVAVAEDMQSKLGDLLEALKTYHTALAATDDIEQAMRTVSDESVAFIMRQKGVWGHSEWEYFVTTMQRNARTWFEGTEAYLGGVLESLKAFCRLCPPRLTSSNPRRLCRRRSLSPRARRLCADNQANAISHGHNRTRSGIGQEAAPGRHRHLRATCRAVRQEYCASGEERDQVNRAF